MSDLKIQVGTRIALDLPDSSGSRALGIPALKSLADLLHILGEQSPPSFPMLRATCSLLVAYLEKPPEEITIDSLNSTRAGFRQFLKGRKYAENSIRSYVNYGKILLNSARDLGWNADDAISKEWRTVVSLARKSNCLAAATHLHQIRKRPEDVTIEDVDNWVQQTIQEGRSYRSASREKGLFWRVLRSCDRTGQVPLCLAREGFGIPLDQFPAALKKEAVELLTWKTAEYALERPKNARMRQVSADGLRFTICQLFGFAKNTCGEHAISSLRELVQKPIVWKFVGWKINVRKVNVRGLQLQLSRLSAALLQHPDYKSLDLTWLKTLLDGLPIEPDSERKRRKARKYLEYTALESIPGKIHSERRVVVKKGAWHLALLVRNELLMKWLPILPWRQRNIRECRIGGPVPNLFRSKIPPFSDVDKPNWVIEEERKNPETEFWQFHFNYEETKTGIDVHAILPRPLIGLLEEYLKAFRAHLLHGPDPGTLFVNEEGHPMTEAQVTNLVGDLAQQYAGKRVTPHPFRDIVAFTWLKEHAKDYLTLSKILWHSNVNTTIREYGSRFNESCGVSAMEAWLEKREEKAK